MDVVTPIPLLALLACSGEAPGARPVVTEDTSPSTSPRTEPPLVLLPETGLTADALGVVINGDDPLSGEIAALYAQARGIPPEHIVVVSLGTGTDADAATFEVAQAQVRAAFGDEVQALALTFQQPYRVSCMATSAAFALGFDARWCQAGPPCRTTAPSPLYDVDTRTPWTELGVRPTMMLAATTLEDAEALIERGVLADDSFPVGTAHLIRTTDAARSVRWADFERTAGRFGEDAAIAVTYRDASTDPEAELLTDADGVLGYQTGLTHVGDLDTVRFLPGALADHLTSFGGVLDGSAGQMPVTDWLRAGATASYGTAIEPCNYEEKFPRASVLWPAYARGATAVEAYWQAVAWPGEGNFVGEPLARPFGHRWTWSEGVLDIETTWLERRGAYRIEAADTPDGPWEVALDGIEGEAGFGTRHLVLENAWRAAYRLVAAD